MRVIGRTISMIRGDSESILVYCQNPDGTAVPFEAGDKVYFTIKTNVNAADKALQKVVENFVEGKALIEITPQDTKELPFTEFVYDVQLTRVDGRITTIIPPSKFVIEGEVTYE